MAIESARLVLSETSRVEEALNYVPLATALGVGGYWGEVVAGGIETRGPAVPGTIVAYLDPGTGVTVATLYTYVYALESVYVDPGTGFVSKSYAYQWVPVDMNWPKIDPNTGKYDNINLLGTDPDYVNPSLR
jgi:hypothetical protein